MIDLADKVALVTGAGRRVGRAMTEALAAAGASVAVHYNTSATEAEALARTLPRAATFAADLRDAHAAQDLPARVVEEFGRLDIVVNSASVLRRQVFGSVTPEAWDDVLAINLRAYFFVAQGAAPHLQASHGVLINLSDLSGVEAWPGYLPHAASKAGVDSLTRGLARVLAPGARVNAIVPGAVLLPDEWSDADAAPIVRTTPLKRIGSPGDVVGALLYLIGAEYVTGATIVVDGGRQLSRREI